jgi:hypothetical protein
MIDGEEADDISHPRGYEEASDEESFEDLFEETDTEADKNMVRKLMTMYETEPSKFDTTQYTINDPFTGNFITIQENRFYVCNSNIFLDEGKFRDFVNALTTLEEVKKIESMKLKVEEICNNLKTIFKGEFDAEVKNFDNAKLDPIYTQLTTLTLPVIPAKLGFVSPATTDVDTKQKRLKDLYANQNLNTTDTFDGKVTLN